jgi:hypothetical protein
MRIERFVHIGDRALVPPSNRSNTLVEKLIAIHDHSLPFAPRLAYLDPALKDIINRAEIADCRSARRSDSAANHGGSEVGSRRSGISSRPAAGNRYVQEQVAGVQVRSDALSTTCRASSSLQHLAHESV